MKNISNISYGIGVLGTGKYIPSHLLENSKIENLSNLPENTILEKTGIKTRYIASKGETASKMASLSAREAVKNANIDVKNVGLIICATFTGDYRYPALACKIQKDIGATNAGAFDIMANCTGFQIAISTATEKMLLNPEIKYALVIGLALQSPFIDWGDSNSSIYFGDGAGAAILGRVPKNYGILSTDIYSNSDAYESVRLRGSGSQYPMSKDNLDPKLSYYEINGLEVWRQLIKYQPGSIKRALKKIKLSIEDVDYFIFHQANLLLIKYLMAKMKVSLSKTITNVEKYGNTADASLAIALDDANREKRLSKDDIIVVSGVGAGFIFGTSIIRWS